jgi:transcriptional regulator with XRE-family HTH domain
VQTQRDIVAAAVRAELARQRITNRMIGRQLGMSDSGIGRRLNGELPFTVEQIVTVARLLNVPLTQLVEGLADADSVPA